ncbi:hypothetical protein L3X38_022774 [Prunus dulcis]|uniref:Protein FAR1-RELATED SEQUENCE n=1 Tax=Prunus dulcis TaxID=3755 RepID=A0AAD4VWL8_PRUDU|nr:hypothetical protein L3X38_022774 [Prunus dulcis]
MDASYISRKSSKEHPEDVSKQDTDINKQCVLDYRNEFITNEIFVSRDALIRWTHEQGKRNGFVIIIKRSDIGGAGKFKTGRILFCCERGGQFRKKKVVESDSKTIHKLDQSSNPPKKKSVKSTGTKKCGCPFSLKGVNYGPRDAWQLEVVCGVHNHHAALNMEGHSYAGRLTVEENLLVVGMSKSLARPNDILYTLKRRDRLNVTTMKTIYNARQKNRVIEKAGMSEMQVLPRKLFAHEYVEWHRSYGTANIKAEYERHLRALQTNFKDHNSIINYVKETWLIPYKERFVAAWTNTCMHFENTTSNRVETAHAKLKKQLGNSMCTFGTSWDKIHPLIELQHTEIKASFEKSLSFVQHDCRKEDFNELIGFVSIFVLDNIMVELKHSETKRHVSMKLQEIMNLASTTLTQPQLKIKTKGHPKVDTSTRRLPSAFEVVLFGQDSAHSTNKVVTRPPRKKPKTIPQKQSVFNSQTQPLPYVNPKKRPSKLPSLTSGFLTYVDTFKGAQDVKSDGNCGFRTIGSLMGFGDNAWRKVRRDLLKELRKESVIYELILNGKERCISHLHFFHMRLLHWFLSIVVRFRLDLLTTTTKLRFIWKVNTLCHQLMSIG